MAFGEDQGDRGQHCQQPVGQLGSARDAVRRVVVAQLAFGANDPLRHRRLGHQERTSDLRGLEPAEQAERERDLCVRGECRVAAQEHQAELVVGDDIDEGVEVEEFGSVVRFHVVGVLHPVGGEIAIGARRFAAQPVDRPVAGGGGDPSARVGWHASDRPAFGGDRKCLGDRVLGEVDVAEDADQGGSATPDLAPEDGSEVLSHPGTDEPRQDPRTPRRTCGPSRARRRSRQPR